MGRSTPRPRPWSSFGPVRLTLVMTPKALAGAGCARSAWRATARRASRTVPHAKPKGAACRARDGVLGSDGAGVGDAAPGEAVGTPIFGPHPAQSTLRVSEKEPGLYVI